jgi:accessory gene regulator B
MDLSEISERLSNTLTAELDYDEEKKEIVAYGIESVALTIAGFLAVILVAVLFRALLPTVIAALFGGMLRKVSGGAHFNTPLKCLVSGAVVYSLLGVTAKGLIAFGLYSTSIYIVVLTICLATVAILAPVDCEAKPIHSRSLRRNLKLASVGFIILALMVVLFSHNIWVNTGAVLGIACQTMTLMPVFNKKRRTEP